MSFNDNHSYLLFNRDPVDKMIGYLQHHFEADSFKKEFNLATDTGTDGARLTHSHSLQYSYVLQTLTLWREILHNMFELWYCADLDVLDATNPPEVKNSIQGVQRIQKSPRVFKAMRRILHHVQTQLGLSDWIGSSVVHLGDSNVPNALAFIDKYNQVSKILTPIVTCLVSLPRLKAIPSVKKFVKKRFESFSNLKLMILTDFFKRGFDGRGALSYREAGSCIDGRLTSAWNWCGELHKKPYYCIFKLSGFTGFDGEFN
jgi:hypothetical protein